MSLLEMLILILIWVGFAGSKEKLLQSDEAEEDGNNGNRCGCM